MCSSIRCNSERFTIHIFLSPYTTNTRVSFQKCLLLPCIRSTFSRGLLDSRCGVSVIYLAACVGWRAFESHDHARRRRFDAWRFPANPSTLPHPHHPYPPVPSSLSWWVYIPVANRAHRTVGQQTPGVERTQKEKKKEKEKSRCCTAKPHLCVSTSFTLCEYVREIPRMWWVCERAKKKTRVRCG